ncbi:putative esterase lipase [Coleophoma crateriformis]|uniref:Putative esterase lipase n=1 Tax=Coleophoma crateriformis TaxID=565419 RepID=A0A3D8T950_9HELO|nr:putative esterase lipase [Coleophoma crateriformis]
MALMALLRYYRLRTFVFFIRLLLIKRGPIPVAPDYVLQIPSRDQNRSIKAHVYRPIKSKTPSPVLINLHGSGFVLPVHGDDDFYCRYVSNHSTYTVFDVQYRLAPENPFPAPLHDVEDVVKYIQSRPEAYDASQISIGGFSAGANLSLAASSMMLPRDTFRSVIAFYPPAEMAGLPETKTPPDTSGHRIPPFLARTFDSAYFQNTDPCDPRISPFYAPAEQFPASVYIVTPAQDYLADEGAEMAGRIRREGGGKYVLHKRVEGCGHGWDKHPKKGSHEERMRDEAYQMAVEILQR